MEDKKLDPEEIVKLFKSFGLDEKTFKEFEDVSKIKEEMESARKFLSGYEQVKTQGELLNWAVRTRFETMATVSALAGTLLIIATFNDRLIILDNFVRVLLSILLVIIPGSLWGLFYEVTKAESDSIKKIYALTEENIGKEAVTKMKTVMKPTLRGAIPFIVNIIFTIVVLLVIILIWR